MEQKRYISALITAVVLLTALTANAAAADYNILTEKETEYYGPTSYEDAYGAYNYGELNRIDYEIPELPYGSSSNAQVGAMERTPLPGSVSAGGDGIAYGIIGGEYPGSTYSTMPETSYPQTTVPKTLFTDAADLKRSDGSVGTLKIPSLGITMKAYPGTSNSSMAKGLGHFTTTSGWDGNIGLCGHNRGSKYVIGSIKDLNIGDTIKYTTTEGTRTYSVTFVGKISNTDWSYLNATTDNRITLITCSAGESTLRWCIQAVEK